MRRLLLSFSLTLSLISAAHAGGSIAWPTPEPPPEANRCLYLGSPIDGWLRGFHDSVVSTRKAVPGPADIIFDGDQQILSGKKAGKESLASRWPNLRALDFGAPNDPTQTVLWRLQQGQADSLNPRVVVLQVGGRNLQENTPEQIAEGVKAVVGEYQKRCPEAVIVLTALFPRADRTPDPFAAKIKAVNEQIATMGDGKKVVFLDINIKLHEADGTISKDVMSDGVHLSGRGLQILADALQPVIEEHTKQPRSGPVENPGAVGGTVAWPAPVPKGGNPATVPTPNLSWIPRFQENMDDAHKLKQVDLIFDGDSITAGWKSGNGGGGIWGRRYAKLNCIDFAQPGHGTQSILWRLNNGQVDGLKPRLIVLLIGTNNLGSTAGQVAEGIKAVVAEYQKRCPDAVILLQGIFPRSEAPNNPARAKIKEVNKIISELGDGKKVIYMDFGDKMLQPDGTLSKEVMPDFLHPAAKGYQIWAEAIQPVIDQFFPPNTTPAAADKP